MGVVRRENNKSWQGCGETGTFVYRWGECKMDAATVENGIVVPQKITI